MSSLQLVSIRLRVANLARSAAFYIDQVGFVATRRGGSEIELAVASNVPPLLTLIEDQTAATPPVNVAGLFHAALLLPSRAALGSWLRGAADRGLAFDGFSDHGVSEAIYFSDPEGNGLEFYADRPPGDWPRDATGRIAMFTRPLAIPSLLAAAPPSGAPPLSGAQWGHLHLRVRDPDRSGEFYRDTLGVAFTQTSYPGARFLGADGYHHHLGLNTWGGVRFPQPPGALGLASAVFATDAHPAGTVRDPDGIEIEVSNLAVSGATAGP